MPSAAFLLDGLARCNSTDLSLEPVEKEIRMVRVG